MTKRALVWFRADLRVADHPALAEASAEAEDGVIGLFVYCPGQWRAHDWGPNRVAWVHHHVASLRSALEERGIPLLVRIVEGFAQVPECLADVAASHGCDGVYWNIEYEINERRRDEAVQQRLEDDGIATHAFHDQLIIPPGEVKTQQDGWYKVFTPFKKRWIECLKEEGGPTEALAAPEPGGLLDEIPSDDLPDALDGYDEYDLTREPPGDWAVGEEAALSRLGDFLENEVEGYKAQRDHPAIDGTSGLSPYLTVGALTTRQCLDALMEAQDEPWPYIAQTKSGPSTWISELIWREFYRHLLVAFPRLCMYRAFQEHTEALEWRDAEDEYEAWCEGKTGYPIIDAAMRQLAETGWMHNRLRMIVAMFLTKHLLIDWRKGERWFMQHLIDGDLASNNGGWQWAASTGTDAAPYFRIFNPWSQSKRYDEDGVFIKRYLPELEDVPAKALHDAKKLAKHKPDEYPTPICDHSDARQRALDAFGQLSKD